MTHDQGRSPTREETATAAPSVRALAGRIGRKAFPLYLSMLSNMVGGLVTAAVLGHTATAELAAYALALAVLNPLLMVVQGCLRGSMPFVAENEDDPASLGSVVRDSIWLSLLVGVLGAGALGTLPLTAPALGVDPAVVAALGSFPLLLAVHTLVLSVKSSVSTLLVGLGETTGVLVVSVVTTVLSVLLTPALVLGTGPVPALGLGGAGVAMLTTSVLTAGLSQYVLRTRTVLRGHRVGVGPPQWASVWHMARVGLPSGATLLVKFGTMSVLAVAVARAGVTEAAAHQLLVVVATFAFLPATAVGQSTVPFVARAAKADDRAGVRSALRAGYTVAVPVVVGSAALLWAAAGPTVSLLTADPGVQTLVVALLPVLCAVVLADTLQALPGMGLLGLKRPRPSLHAFAVCYGLLAVAAVPLAAHGGLALLWGAYAVATACLFLWQTTAFHLTSARL
ncbi:putative multidrug resistance protein NorM [Nocardiopsis kunsanensis]|uniref:Probable multidrug resistance protein NorM n=1 Tax=Nocardiopsis kunsanensis TaxID=141693 RepID=A0A918XFP3_9ACTN|nr:MATE family efflux transporter [Nocardiopsis kunsanensis]GHD29979.1 putative multidrug resistance protein NorM [Nocardiopsis kunsanensis]